MSNKQVFSFVMLIGVLFPDTTASANPAAAWALEQVAAFLAQEALGAIWDQATGKVNTAELGRRLEQLEEYVGQADTHLSAEIARLRRRLDEKVDRQEVEAIMKRVLEGLEARIAAAEAQAARIEQRYAEIESKLLIVPTISPSPVLRTTRATDKVAAHPLVAEWAILLSRSEESRLRVGELMRTHRPASPELKRAVADDMAILAQTERLRSRIHSQLLTFRDDRHRKLVHFTPSHPTVRDLEASISSLIWLRGVVTTPSPSKRLQVPVALLEHESSDILAAFELAGADSSNIAGLFRILMFVQFQRDYGKPPCLDAYVDSLLGNLHGRTVEATPIPDSLGAEAATVEEFLKGAMDLAGSVGRCAEQLLRAEKVYGPANPTFMALHDERDRLLEQLRPLHTKADRELTRCLALYVQTLKSYRPASPGMRAFRERRLLPLWALCALTHGLEWSSSSELDELWARFSKLGAALVVREQREARAREAKRREAKHRESLQNAIGLKNTMTVDEKMKVLGERSRLTEEAIYLRRCESGLELHISTMLSGSGRHRNLQSIVQRQGVKAELLQMRVDLRRMKQETEMKSFFDDGSIAKAHRSALEKIRQRLTSLGLPTW